MDSNQLPENSDTLFALASEVGDLVAENRRKAGIRQNAEALLRASLAAAMFARNAHPAQLIGEIANLLSDDDLVKVANYVLLVGV